MLKLCRAAALGVLVVSTSASAQLTPASRPLDPDLPSGIDIFRSICLQAGFSGAEAAAERARLRRTDFAPVSSVWADRLTAGESYLRGDPTKKSVDDVVVTLGAAERSGTPFETCSVFSFVAPLTAIEALGLMVDPERLKEASRADQPFAVVPPILGLWSVPGVAGSRAVTLLSLARTGRPDAPGTILALDTMTAADAARLAGSSAGKLLFEKPLPSYGEALRQLKPKADLTQPQASAP